MRVLKFYDFHVSAIINFFDVLHKHISIWQFSTITLHFYDCHEEKKTHYNRLGFLLCCEYASTKTIFVFFFTIKSLQYKCVASTCDTNIHLDTKHNIIIHTNKKCFEKKKWKLSVSHHLTTLYFVRCISRSRLCMSSTRVDLELTHRWRCMYYGIEIFPFKNGLIYTYIYIGNVSQQEIFVFFPSHFEIWDRWKFKRDLNGNLYGPIYSYTYM